METVPMQIIAHIHSEFATKFGVPRQSGLVEELTSTIVFEPDFRNPDALRGLEEFSHLWLLWHFDRTEREGWSPTVRPPRLGGNVRMGVFATRSPFRPNAIGLSAVRLLAVERHPRLGPLLRVAGADLIDGTPIFDVKPYLPYADCHSDAVGGFAAVAPETLEVDCPAQLLIQVPPEHRQALLGVLAQDPRPSYQKDAQRVYGLDFAGCNIRFRVEDGRLAVLEISPPAQ